MRSVPTNSGRGRHRNAVAFARVGGGIPTSTQWLEEVVVSGKLERLGGDPASATVGIATSEQLDLRPVLRTGELLEVVPGTDRHAAQRQRQGETSISCAASISITAPTWRPASTACR
jgi:hypothetical protein